MDIGPKFLLLCLLIGSANASVISVALGQLFSIRLEGDDTISTDGLPSWMRFDASQSTLYGVPSWVRQENVTLHTKNGETIEINTNVELDICENEYAFVEKYFNQDYNLLTPEKLKNEITNFASEFEIKESDVRAYRVDEMKKYRELVDEPLITMAKEIKLKPSQLVLWTKIACGPAIDAGEIEPEIVSHAGEQNDEQKHIVLGQAKVRKDDILAEQTATPAPMSRTTRMINDSPPNVYNKIKKFNCLKGKLCKQALPATTFIDREDGNLLNLKTKIFSTGKHPNVFTVTGKKTDSIFLEGVPLTNGTFEFRFEVRDSSNQPANDVFTVEVENQPEPNHLFELVLDAKYKKFVEKPELLTEFIKKISERVGGNPEDVQVDSLTEQDSQTILRWSNASLSRTNCIEKVINETNAKMIGKGKKKGITEFAKYMGSEYAVREVNIKLQGTCVTHTVTPQIIRVHATTSQTTTEEESGVSNLLLIILAVVTIVILLIIFAVVCLCLKKKQAPKKSQEYTTKGTPIVFPDDVQHDDETNGATAAVTTPMLVSHEHPPLNPTTLHENPIYKPPSEHGTPNRNAMGKRLPPPYVAP